MTPGTVAARLGRWRLGFGTRCPGQPDQDTSGRDSEKPQGRQHTQEDVRLDPVLQVVEDRALAERALHCPERRLDPCQQDVGPPDVLVGQILPVGLEQIPAVEAGGQRFLLRVSAHVTAAVVASYAIA